MKSKDTKTIKGNGHINVSNVNAMNSECITMSYTIWQFKGAKQVGVVQKGIKKLLEPQTDDVQFHLEISDYQGADESYKLKTKIKSCRKEKEAHTIKGIIDEYIRGIGGQTTLDESIGDGED